MLPNRTALAVADMSRLVESILDLVVSTNSAKQEMDVFNACLSRFRETQFSETMKPLSSVLESQYPHDVAEIFHIILVLSIRKLEPVSTQPLECQVLVYLLYIVVACNDSVLRRGSCKRRARIPVTSVDIRKFTEIVRCFSNSSLVARMIRFLFDHHFEPRSSAPTMYVDHSGHCSLRNNSVDSLAKQVAMGAETGRSVSVQEDSNSGNPILVNADGEVILDPLRQLTHNPELQKEILKVFSELCDVIPPPVLTEGESSEEEKDAMVGLMPSESVRMMLKDGRTKRRRKAPSDSKSKQ